MLKKLKLFDADPESIWPWIRDGKIRIRDNHPGSATLDKSIYCKGPCVSNTLLCSPKRGEKYTFVFTVPQGVTKRCRLSLLTNSALVHEPKCGGMGGGGRGVKVSANEFRCAHHVTWSPHKLWRSTSIFNLCRSRSNMHQHKEVGSRSYNVGTVEDLI